MEHRTKSQKIGQIGENIAVSYLIRQGYKILERNKHLGSRELDIIATKDKLTCFIEVKTVSNNSSYPAEDRLSKKKLRLLKRASHDYCLILAINEEYTRIELVAITLNYSNNLANIKHYLTII